jgi:calmodulin
MSNFKDVLSYLDPTKQGLLDLKDLGTALRCLGLNPTECEVEELKEESENNNGKVNEGELIRLFNKCKLNQVTNKEEVVKFFKSLEKNNDGQVDARELKIALCNAGEPLADKDVLAVFQEFGIAEDGKIKFNDLIEGLFLVK